MQLTRAHADALIRHARAEYPNECCGLIAGHGDVAGRVLPTTNAEGTPFMYVMDPHEQMRLMDEIDEAGEDLVAIYHSHTRSAAYPSTTDVDLAFFADPLYVIVSLQVPDDPVIRAFRLARSAPAGEQITEVQIEVRDT